MESSATDTSSIVDLYNDASVQDPLTTIDPPPAPREPPLTTDPPPTTSTPADPDAIHPEFFKDVRLEDVELTLGEVTPIKRKPKRKMPNAPPIPKTRLVSIKGIPVKRLNCKDLRRIGKALFILNHHSLNREHFFRKLVEMKDSSDRETNNIDMDELDRASDQNPNRVQNVTVPRPPDTVCDPISHTSSIETAIHRIANIETALESIAKSQEKLSSVLCRKIDSEEKRELTDRICRYQDRKRKLKNDLASRCNSTEEARRKLVAFKKRTAEKTRGYHDSDLDSDSDSDAELNGPHDSLIKEIVFVSDEIKSLLKRKEELK